MRRNSRIVVTASDLERLRAVLGSREGSALDREHLLDLRDELEQARVVPEEEIPADVVTLYSQVRVRDRETGVSSDYTIVSPALANVELGHISVVAPLGTALLGYRVGDQLDWQMPGGVRRFQIERVKQPQRRAPRQHVASNAAGRQVTA
jgi:regulator of nucleoside diphosphate kinase